MLVADDVLPNADGARKFERVGQPFRNALEFLASRSDEHGAEVLERARKVLTAAPGSERG